MAKLKPWYKVVTPREDLREGKLGKVAMPLRAALTGTTVSPSIFHAASILGKEESCARIQAALSV